MHNKVRSKFHYFIFIIVFTYETVKIFNSIEKIKIITEEIIKDKIDFETHNHIVFYVSIHVIVRDYNYYEHLG